MALEKIVKGDELMLFKGETSIGYAKSHTLSISGNAIDISSKDHGFWGASDIGNITWEITSENLYTDKYYGQLFDAMINRTQLVVAFGYASDWDVDGLTGNNTQWDLDKTKNYYSGKVYVTSLTANANTGENATFSITLTGCGALELKGDIPSPDSGGSGSGTGGTGGTGSGSGSGSN